MDHKSTDLLDLAGAARMAPGKPHIATIWRWARKGVRGRNGTTVKLRHVRAGGRLFIPFDALNEFFTATAAADAEHFDRESAAHVAPCDAPRGRTPKQRERAIERAEKTLAAAGIL